MARLHTSGTLTLNQVIAFFGAGDSLADFRRGFGIVPNIPENAGVPSSLPISLRDLLGVYDASPVTALSVNIGSTSPAVPVDSVSPFSTSSSVTPSISGGSGARSYSWTYVSGDSFSLSSTTSPNITFSKTGTTIRDYSGVYRLTVTDSTGSVSDTVSVFHRHGSA